MTAGRPKKMVSIPKIQLHFLDDVEHVNRFKKGAEELGMSDVEYLNWLIDMTSWNEKLKAAISKLDLQKKAIEAQKQADAYRAQLAQLELEERQKEEIAEQIRRTNTYLITAFREFYKSEKSNGRITMFPEAIEKIFGITFNIEKCNKNFEEINDMDDDELIGFLEIKKIKGHAKKEEEILRKIGGI